MKEAYGAVMQNIRFFI